MVLYILIFKFLYSRQRDKGFGPKGGRNNMRPRKLHNEELHNFYSSPNIIKIIKSMRMRLAGNLARMGRRGMHIGFW
jgi:hypothetical protein